MNDVTRETVILNELDNEADFNISDYFGNTNNVLNWFGDALRTVSPISPRLLQFNQADGDGIAFGFGLEADGAAKVSRWLVHSEMQG